MLDVSLGDEFTCAITAPSNVYCWGYGRNGQLGNGGTATLPTPQRVTLVGANNLSAGSQHVCATTTTGDVYCWGSGSDGRLGTGRPRPKVRAHDRGRALLLGWSETPALVPVTNAKNPNLDRV